jgi:dTDP-4-amino-4,6-dideoxygalactose transaminase
VAERVGRETVTLPLFPAMRDDDVARVCEELRAELRKAQTQRPLSRASLA